MSFQMRRETCKNEDRKDKASSISPILGRWNWVKTIDGLTAYREDRLAPSLKNY